MKSAEEQQKEILSIAQDIFGADGKVNIEIEFKNNDECFYLIFEMNFFTFITSIKIETFVEEVEKRTSFLLPNTLNNIFITSTDDKRMKLFFDIVENI